jgi:transcriptional regulator with XRE-family HTH domain
MRRSSNVAANLEHRSEVVVAGKSRLDTEALYAALDAQRQGRSWRQLAKEVGVSPSTMTRLAQGQRPDIDAFAALVRWLGQPADLFLVSDSMAPAEDPDLVAQIAPVLRARRDIDEADARYLEDLLKVGSQGLRTKMNHKFGDLYEPFVEWVYDHSDSRLGDVEFREFSEAYKLDGDNSFALLRYCKERGLLDDKFSTLGGPAANMTPAGIQWVEERKRRRADPALRIAAARKGLLIWLWKQKQTGAHFPITEKFLDFDDSVFEGDRLQADEVDRASAYLAEKGLISGVTVDERRGPVRAETTSAGDDCVERYGGDVAEYERRDVQASGPVFHIHGDNTGNIAANSRDVTMNAQTVKGVNMSHLVIFARALRQATPMLGLPDEETSELVELANRIEQEASGEAPDLNRLQRWGANVLGLLNSPVVSGALGGLLAAYGGTVLPGLQS